MRTLYLFLSKLLECEMKNLCSQIRSDVIQFSRCPRRVKEAGLSNIVVLPLCTDIWTVFAESSVLFTCMGITAISFCVFAYWLGSLA